jgi:hypothetical protein
MGADGQRLFGNHDTPIRYRLIVDPIDGTRGLMYDKRSAWFIAAIAHDRGEHTRLSDTFAAALVELPTGKQNVCDSFTATVAGGMNAQRTCLADGHTRLLPVRPSGATTPQFGFGHVASFFPGTKVLAAELVERIAAETMGRTPAGQSLLFDDQYISSGGQMVELMVGHDRFCCDLRPLFYQILEAGEQEVIRGVECHPYDVAGALVARQAGVVLTDGFGRPLDCPYDVHTPVHWCGFGNEILANLIQPVIADWLAEQDVFPD